MALRISLPDLKPDSKLAQAINNALGAMPRGRLNLSPPNPSKETSKGKKKYRNKITYVEGKKFDSQAEARYYVNLRKREIAGGIDNLKLQPRFPILINEIVICTVVLDFTYRDVATGKVHFVDVKGMDNPLSKLKRKLVEAMYMIEVELPE